MENKPIPLVTRSDHESLKLHRRGEASPVSVSYPQIGHTLLDFGNVGGLDKQVKELIKRVCIPAEHRTLFEQKGPENSHGILIHGPQGTGKTLLAKTFMSEVNKNYKDNDIGYVDCGNLHGASDLQEILLVILNNIKTPSQTKYSALIIDNLDVLSFHDTFPAHMGILIRLLMENNVTIIGIAKDKDRIGSNLFEYEIETEIPDKRARLEILKILTKNMDIDPRLDLQEVANMTEGYTGRDLKLLLGEATLISVDGALNRALSVSGGTYSINDIALDNIRGRPQYRINQVHILAALARVKPSVLKGSEVCIPDIRWKSVGGLEKVIAELKEAVELPLKNPGAFKKFGIRPVRGIILYGPPGNGKTLLAKAVANESNANFISVKATELFNKYVGESEALTRQLFKKARAAAPSIVFIDEIDGLGKSRTGNMLDSGVRESVLNTLLMELDGVEELNGVVVIGATNRPDLLDGALLRPGRFDNLIEIPLPNEAGRLEIFKVHTSGMPLDQDVKFVQLAKAAEGYSGAEIENVCREAGMNAIRHKEKSVHAEDFAYALGKIKPMVNENIKEYRMLRRDERKPIGFSPNHTSK
ncbi:MAG: AAA family ATPase [Candidatus Marsarchaeota archaeon]|nr:AAA family ATPase [Candidatus Marsarchaeota archaeon]MCL5413548.1 AAA family ATPase [Candidatus Marsarchaeota archaeon]